MQTQLKYKNLIDLFNESLSDIKPDTICLEIVRATRHEKLSFSQLKAQAYSFALLLINEAGIEAGDKVAILGKNRIDWDIAFWGAILTGAVPVLIDPERALEGVVNHLLHTDCRALIMADDYQDSDSRHQIKNLAAKNDLAFVEMTDGPLCTPPTDSPEPPSLTNLHINADDTAAILCTSGTTGDPREVELTHGNLIANTQGSFEKIRITKFDKLGHILPPHHSFGLTVGKLLPLCVGATSIYTDQYRRISELIKDKNITIFIAVPALFTVLAKKLEDALAKEKKQKLLVRFLDRYAPKLLGKIIIKKQGWSNLRFFLSGAAPVPRWVLDVFWKRGLKLCEGYGTTENSPVYGFNDNPRKLGSVGKPLSTIMVKIVDETGKALLPGRPGEILLGGPCVMKGYYKNAEATQSVIETDPTGTRWLHTGDLGYLDDKGNLFITGRKKFLIVLPGGKNVNPELVESALSEARFIKDILVVPTIRKHETGLTEETIKAIAQPDIDAIRLHTRLATDELLKQPQLLRKLIWQSIDQCQRKTKRLAHFEKISSHQLEIKIDEFQRTSTGKIKRDAYIRL